jgi:hypothetical protein
MLAALVVGTLAASGCSVDLASLLAGDDDWLDSSDSCSDHPHHRSAPASAPANQAAPFPAGTR